MIDDNGRQMTIQCKCCKGWHWDFYDYCVECGHGYDEMDMTKMFTIEWYKVIQ